MVGGRRRGYYNYFVFIFHVLILMENIIFFLYLYQLLQTDCLQNAKLKLTLSEYILSINDPKVSVSAQ